MTKPVIFVLATDHGFAAGRDQEIHLHAIPCSECETRFVLPHVPICRHCLEKLNVARMKFGAVCFVMIWLFAFGAAVRALAGLDLNSDMAYLIASAVTMAIFTSGVAWWRGSAFCN